MLFTHIATSGAGYVDTLESSCAIAGPRTAGSYYTGEARADDFAYIHGEG